MKRLLLWIGGAWVLVEAIGLVVAVAIFVVRFT